MYSMTWPTSSGISSRVYARVVEEDLAKLLPHPEENLQCGDGEVCSGHHKSTHELPKQPENENLQGIMLP